MKRIGIISQSPTLKTGFGISTKVIADGLVAPDTYVTCFGIDQTGETFERTDYNYKIWTVGNTDLFKSVELFVRTENLDVIIINFDVVNLGRYYHITRKVGYTKKLIAHLVLDGTPFLYGNLNFLNDCYKVVVSTKHTFDYLAAEHKIENLILQHQGVDANYFKPLKNKEETKIKANLNNKIIIGCFGRNTERKQQPIFLEAIKILKESYNLNDFIAYLHCSPIDTLMSWSLLDIAEYLGVANVVFFKDYNGVDNNNGNSKKTFFSELSLSEKVGVCDVCINIPFCGGVELHNLEVQSCGVPLITTNDYGNIAEVVNDGAILLEAEHIGIWRTGAKQYFISAKELAASIFELIKNEELRNDLSARGRDNAKKYFWKNLQNELKNLIYS